MRKFTVLEEFQTELFSLKIFRSELLQRIQNVYFQSIDVDKALNEKKIIVDLDERTDFAAQLEEIESRVDDTQMDEAEINEDDIRLDPRMPKEGRERFLRARCRVLQDEVNRLQKEYQLTNDKWHQARRQAQDRAEQITKERFKNNYIAQPTLFVHLVV